MATLLVNDVTPRVQYTATASQTTFAYPFAIFADGDLKVYQTLSGADADDTADILILATDYTVTGAGGTSGGNVVLNTGAASGDIITIERDLAVERTTDYQNLGDLLSETFNDDLDKIIMFIQQVESLANRSLRLSRTNSQITDTNLPAPVAGELLRVNSSGNGYDSVAAALIGALTTVSENDAGTLLTVASDVKLPSDSYSIVMGTTDDFSIYRVLFNTIMQNDKGTLSFLNAQASQPIYFSAANSGGVLEDVMELGGATTLAKFFYDDAESFRTGAGGISFDAGATVLDNYTEKTSFTPTIYGDSTAGTPTYTTQSGYYWRIGNILHVDIEIRVNTTLGGMAGNVRIGGLPVAAAATNPAFSGLTAQFYFGASLAAGSAGIGMTITAGANSGALQKHGALGSSVVAVSEITTSFWVMLTGTYCVD